MTGDRDEATVPAPDSIASVPPKLRRLASLLRRLPPGLAHDLLAALAIADGARRADRRRRALAWASAQPGLTSLAARRLALRLLATHGRFVAHEMMLGSFDPSGLRRTTRLVGVEHLDQVRAGVILLGSHLGPPRAWLALRAYGYPVRTARRMEHVENVEAARAATDRALVVRLPGGDPQLRVQALYRMRRLLAGGKWLSTTCDGPFGSEAFRIDLPGGPLIVRNGWLALRRLTGVPTIPVLSHMDGPRRVVTMHPPLPPVQPDSRRDAEACRAALTPLLQAYVREHPEQCRYLAFPDWA